MEPKTFELRKDLTLIFKDNSVTLKILKNMKTIMRNCQIADIFIMATNERLYDDGDGDPSTFELDGDDDVLCNKLPTIGIIWMEYDPHSVIEFTSKKATMVYSNDSDSDTIELRIELDPEEYEYCLKSFMSSDE